MCVCLQLLSREAILIIRSTASRKNFVSVDTFIAEPDSRAQCAALEENVKEFGLTYFGMKDRRQGELRFAPEIQLLNYDCRNCSCHWSRTRIYSTSPPDFSNSPYLLFCSYRYHMCLW